MLQKASFGAVSSLSPFVRAALQRRRSNRTSSFSFTFLRQNFLLLVVLGLALSLASGGSVSLTASAFFLISHNKKEVPNGSSRSSSSAGAQRGCTTTSIFLRSPPTTSTRMSSSSRPPPTTVPLLATTNNTDSSVPSEPPQQRILNYSTLIQFQDTSTTANGSLSESRLTKRTESLLQFHNGPMTEQEFHQVLYPSLRNYLVQSVSQTTTDVLQHFCSRFLHLSHKDWKRTEENAETLGKLLQDDDNQTSLLHSWMERCFTEGNWKGAEESSASSSDKTRQPWAVLVTGVNGIRKTTSIYQPWFGELLQEALVVPKGKEDTGAPADLPTGSNSFFRQLDHIICSAVNEEFARMYALTAQELDENHDGPNIPPRIVQEYSSYKAAIFTRYRTLSELLGVLLIRDAQQSSLNCMLETSGRDVAMFHYVDHFFPEPYQKLALHFVINDLSYAQQSVDQRMIHEIQAGVTAIEKIRNHASSSAVKDVVYANEGGPYGSSVLAGVQKDSDNVWNEVVMKDEVGKDWYKATIQINASDSKPWTAQAVRPDGSLGKVFTFQR